MATKKICMISGLGVSLLESLCAVLIVGSLLAVSAPAVSELVVRYRIQHETEQLKLFLKRLRIKSLVSKTPLIVKLEEGGYSFIDGEFPYRYQLPDKIKLETERETVLFSPGGYVSPITLSLRGSSATATAGGANQCKVIVSLHGRVRIRCNF